MRKLLFLFFLLIPSLCWGGVLFDNTEDNITLGDLDGAVLTTGSNTTLAFWFNTASAGAPSAFTRFVHRGPLGSGVGDRIYHDGTNELRIETTIQII